MNKKGSSVLSRGVVAVILAVLVVAVLAGSVSAYTNSQNCNIFCKVWKFFSGSKVTSHVVGSGSGIPGDFNNDGVLDQADADILSDCYGSDTNSANWATCYVCDIWPSPNGNGHVDIPDVAAFSNYLSCGQVFFISRPSSSRLYNHNCCGNGICDTPAEDTGNCAQDCLCGNGVCGSGENYSNCPQDCQPTQICGNGAVESGEQCDDNNVNAGDGCSATCTIESGYSCTGEPSVCTILSTCGNGVKEGSEQCDGTDLGGQSCVGLGYDNGTLACNACIFNTNGCSSVSDSDGDGVLNGADMCPTIKGPASRFGCPYLINNYLEMRVTDNVNASLCANGKKECKYPLANVPERLFRITSAAFISRWGKSDVKPELMGAVYEANVASVGEKTTGSDGYAKFGVPAQEKYLKIAKYVWTDLNGKTWTVYTGKYIKADNFKDSDKDKKPDTAENKMHKIKISEKDSKSGVIKVKVSAGQSEII